MAQTSSSHSSNIQFFLRFNDFVFFVDEASEAFFEGWRVDALQEAAVDGDGICRIEGPLLVSPTGQDRHAILRLRVKLRCCENATSSAWD